MFFSTFVLIFLAELGDKTQLTALARSATGGKWVVFAAASLALVCSTLVAVLFGSVIRRYIPEQNIKIAAGGLFLIFGVFTLVSALQGEKAAPSTTVDGSPAPWVFRLAAGFEESAIGDYEKLAAKSEGHIRDLFLSLAQEEREHLAQLREGHVLEDSPVNRKHFADLFHNVAEDEKPIIKHAAEHERATAEFYEELSRQITIGGVKTLFAQLAREEFSHAERLEALAVKV